MVHQEGISIGREKFRLIGYREGLQVSVKSPKRRRRGISIREVSKARYPGHVWSYDFIFERTEDGRTLKFLAVVAGFSQVALSLSCVLSLTGLPRRRDAGDVAPRLGSTGIACALITAVSLWLAK